MSADYRVAEVIHMLVVWVPVLVVFVAFVRLLWRAGDPRPDRGTIASQIQLQEQIDVLVQEIRGLRQQLGIASGGLSPR